MPRRGRRRRFWAVADSYVQPVSTGSTDSRSENAYRTDESRRYGPAEPERCGHGGSGFLCGRPRGRIGPLCGTGHGDRPVGTSVEKGGYPSSAFRPGWRAYFLIFNAGVGATGRVDRVPPDSAESRRIRKLCRARRPVRGKVMLPTASRDLISPLTPFLDNRTQKLPKTSCVLKHLGPIPWGECLGLCSELRLRRLVELGRRRGPSRDGNANLREEVLLAGCRANAQQPDRFCG